MMRNFRGVHVILFSLLLSTTILFQSNSGAQAANEKPADYAIPEVIDSHFYDIAVAKITTSVGSPYLTTLSASNVLSLDWDFELALTDVLGGGSTFLGSLNIPSGARVLDFQYFSEWRATTTSVPTFVSYSVLEPDSQCHRMYLRQTKIDLTGKGENFLGKIWFKSPCFPKVDDFAFTLAQSGGRIALIPKAMRVKPQQPEIFMGVGDFRIARPADIVMSKLARNMLSTIIRISKPGKYSVWTRGLRNPQGLVMATLDGRNELIATSQGPRGGDDLVSAEKGLDFGWPYVSYGTAYRNDDLPDTPYAEGVHQVSSGKVSLPLFSWVPSIGASALTQISGSAFSRWWGQTKNGDADLLVSGMGSRWLYRVVVDGGAVRSYEGLYIGARARSIAQLPNGYIVAGLDAGNELIVLKPLNAWNSTFEAKVPVS